MRFLVGTIAHNQHVQNIVGALYEAGALGRFYTGGVDHWNSSLARRLRKVAGERVTQVNARLSRRRISTVPEEFVSADWSWEGWRLFARYAGLGRLVEDWFWERSELALDRTCAKMIGTAQYDTFFGVEHGALFSIQAARSAGKQAVVGFLRPHHKTQERWVDPQYDRFPELWTPATRRLREKARQRDARRDEEARLASVIHCASNFTRNSLIAQGLPPRKMVMVPLGCPEVVSAQPASVSPSHNTLRFIYSGPVSVRKGAHLLLEAWNLLAPRSGAELHFYGVVTLPKTVVERAGAGVFFHGSVSKAEMARAYQEASILVFPTLCDGFGMVVAEALAHGVPVIATPNAGAADLIAEGRNGFLVPPGETAPLAERIAWCLDHADDLRAMREEALAMARSWTWSDFRASFRNQLFPLLQDVALASACRRELQLAQPANQSRDREGAVAES
jgi:glycosyltransferase involved in cell wall biosynthesis